MSDTPSSAGNRHDVDVWCHFRLRGLREAPTRDGVMWSAEVIHSDQVVGTAIDHGDGGGVRLRWIHRVDADEAEAAGRRVMGRTGVAYGDPAETLVSML